MSQVRQHKRIRCGPNQCLVEQQIWNKTVDCLVQFRFCRQLGPGLFCSTNDQNTTNTATNILGSNKPARCWFSLACGLNSLFTAMLHCTSDHLSRQALSNKDFKPEVLLCSEEPIFVQKKIKFKEKIYLVCGFFYALPFQASLWVLITSELQLQYSWRFANI